MLHFTDQTDRTVTLDARPPRRIISLVPSQTELLYALGLREEVVGITKFCVHPADWYREKPRVGGTKTLNFEKIAALRPDLILANKEENEEGQIRALAARYPVWISDIYTLTDACSMIRSVGVLTGRPAEGIALADRIEQGFETLHLPPGFKARRAAYFIWRKPYMVAAADTFIDAMLQAAGFENVFGDRLRYPEIGLEELAAADPELILLSSEPFPFAEKHFAPFLECCLRAKIAVVDGELFSWYGSRLLEAPAYFLHLRQTL